MSGNFSKFFSVSSSFEGARSLPVSECGADGSSLGPSSLGSGSMGGGRIGSVGAGSSRTGSGSEGNSSTCTAGGDTGAFFGAAGGFANNPAHPPGFVAVGGAATAGLGSSVVSDAKASLPGSLGQSSAAGVSPLVGVASQAVVSTVWAAAVSSQSSVVFGAFVPFV